MYDVGACELHCLHPQLIPSCVSQDVSGYEGDLAIVDLQLLCSLGIYKKTDKGFEHR